MSRPRERLFIMVDVETTGPILGRHSLVELGAAVGSQQEGLIGRFSTHILPISEEVRTSRRSYEQALVAGRPPAEAMARFQEWARPHLERGGTFTARPAAFDWPWIVYYAWTYLKENPFGFKAVCASSWLEAHGRRFEVRLPHIAVEDAEIQLRHFLEHLG